MLEERVEFGTAQQMISADEDFEVPSGLKLDLACGQRKKEGFLGVDLLSEEADIRCNLEEYPWPFEDGSVYEINCSHYVEHVRDLVKFVNEVHRILMPHGTITIIAPYYTSIRAWQDPTHVRAITELTFQYFDKALAKDMGVDHYLGDADFETLAVKYVLNKEWECRGDEARKWAYAHYWNVVDDIIVQMRKRG